VHPQVSGAAQFNTAMVNALADMGPVQALSWRRLYPPLIHRREAVDRASAPTRLPAAQHILDWADPRSWRLALRLSAEAGARALVLPWLHPVMAPPYRYLLRHAPRDVSRVLICHNVEPHERVPLGRTLTRAVVRHADLLVIHASHQREELRRLGVPDEAIVDAFHPRFAAADLCALPTDVDVRAERARQGSPRVSLLAFGAIRPYKGIDLALEAMSRLPTAAGIRLTIAGVCWDGGRDLRRQIDALGLADRVELRDGFVSNEEAALLFSAADATILPYRSATQSGVVQLSFGYGVPVIATAVGGLVEAVAHERDGLLCPAEDVPALVAAIERMAAERTRLAAGVRHAAEATSFRRYAEIIHAAVAARSAVSLAALRPPAMPSSREILA
jgi:glycosyltransferase involved in cell wall biosynthesis